MDKVFRKQKFHHNVLTNVRNFDQGLKIKSIFDLVFFFEYIATLYAFQNWHAYLLIHTHVNIII